MMKRNQLMRKFSVLGVLIFSTLSFLTYGQGSTYTGSYVSSSRMEYSAKTNMVIEGKSFNNTTGHSITKLIQPRHARPIQKIPTPFTRTCVAGCQLGRVKKTSGRVIRITLL